MNQNQFTENSLLAIQEAQELAIKAKQTSIKPEFLALALLKIMRDLFLELLKNLI